MRVDHWGEEVLVQASRGGGRQQQDHGLLLVVGRTEEPLLYIYTIRTSRPSWPVPSQLSETLRLRWGPDVREWDLCSQPDAVQPDWWRTLELVSCLMCSESSWSGFLCHDTSHGALGTLIAGPSIWGKWFCMISLPQGCSKHLGSTRCQVSSQRPCPNENFLTGMFVGCLGSLFALSGSSVSQGGVFPVSQRNDHPAWHFQGKVRLLQRRRYHGGPRKSHCPRPDRLKVKSV